MKACTSSSLLELGRSIMISSKYAMYDKTDPCCYAVHSLSWTIFSSSRTLNCSKNLVENSVSITGAVPRRSRWSSHLLALPCIKVCAIAFIWALCLSLCLFNSAAIKCLLTYLSQDLELRFSTLNAFGPGTLIWMLILTMLLIRTAVWISPAAEYCLQNSWVLHCCSK